jgi:hypothetical protein
VQRRSFDNLAPVDILSGFEDQFARPVASIEAAGHDCRKEEVVIRAGTIRSRDKGLEMFNTQWLFMTDRVSTDLF